MRTSTPIPDLETAVVALAGRLRATAATVALVAGLVGLAAAAGALLAGRWGALIAVAFAAVSGYAGARAAAGYVLRAAGARPLHPREAPVLFGILRSLSARAGIPVPRLWLVPAVQPNAFTVGRDPGSAHVAVSAGLLRALDRRELAGVLAHEVAHIRRRDILLTSFAASVTSLLASARRGIGLLLLLAFPLLFVIGPQLLAVWALLALAPVVAVLLQAALSRQREYAADAEAARLTGDPLGLAAALRRLAGHQRSWLATVLGRVPPDELRSPWHTHPPSALRIQRLEALAGQSLPAVPRPAPPRLAAVRPTHPRPRPITVPYNAPARTSPGQWTPTYTRLYPATRATRYSGAARTPRPTTRAVIAPKLLAAWRLGSA